MPSDAVQRIGEITRAIRLDLSRHWSVNEMAAIVGIRGSQLRRLCSLTLQISPAAGTDSETLALLSGHYLIFAAGEDADDPIRVEIVDEGFLWKVAEVVVNAKKNQRYATASVATACLCRIKARPATARANGDYSMSIAIVQPSRR